MTRFKLFNKTATEGSLSKNGFIAGRANKDPIQITGRAICFTQRDKA